MLFGRRTALPLKRGPLAIGIRLLVVTGALLLIGLFTRTGTHNADGHGDVKYRSRHLLSSVEWETCAFEVGSPRNHSVPTSQWYTPTSAYGWVALYVLLILIIFVALALICDDFFVPSLEAISESLDLSEDVAGATFMAAGSSAPELFTSIAGVSVESDVGVGTIVGSAAFNLLGIVALSAAFAGQVLHLDWRPLARDATFYALSVILFIIFAWDGKFYLYESVLMLAMYFVYIVIMKFNPSLMAFLSKLKKPKIHPTGNAVPYIQDESVMKEDIDGDNNGVRRFSHVKKGELASSLVHQHHHHHGEHSSESETNNNGNTGDGKASGQGNDTTPSGDNNTTIIAEPPCTVEFRQSVQSTDSYDDEPSMVVCPCLPPIMAECPSKDGKGLIEGLKYCLSWILFLISFPFLVMFTWTIPNCSRPETRKYFMLSFIMSIVWIAVLSFGMVTLVGRAGCILGIDKFTMGLVVVAIGTSIPDALSSVLVARDGYGDMAVSNAIGSNVFDIDLGIGLPFVISILIRGMKPVLLLSAQEQAMFDNGEILIIPHAKFGFLLLFILLLSLIVFVCSGFKMTKRLGIIFVCMYICFVCYAYVQDLYCTHSC